MFKYRKRETKKQGGNIGGMGAPEKREDIPQNIYIRLVLDLKKTIKIEPTMRRFSSYIPCCCKYSEMNE